MTVNKHTPANYWMESGEPDPHGATYDCERWQLAMGKLTDDELANGAFMNYDIRPPVADIISGKAFSPIAWMTAVKDRIRWLSRRLIKAEKQRDELFAKLDCMEGRAVLAEAKRDEAKKAADFNLEQYQDVGRLLHEACEQRDKLLSSALRAVEAWDTTVLPASSDGMMQERMESLRASVAAVKGGA